MNYWETYAPVIEESTSKLLNQHCLVWIREQRERNKVQAELYTAQELDIVLEGLEMSPEVYCFDFEGQSTSELHDKAAKASNPDILYYMKP